MKRTLLLVLVLLALGALVALAAFASRGSKSGIPVAVATVKPQEFVTKLPENGTILRPRTQTIPALVSGNIKQLYVKAGQTVSAGQLLATISNPTLEFQAAGSQADYDTAVANVGTARINEQNAKAQYQGQVETTKSNLDLAQRIYDADVALYKNKAIPRQTMDSDRAKLDQARVTYQQAVEQLKLGAVSGFGQDSVQAAKAALQKSQILNQQSQQQVSFTRITAPFDGIIQTVAVNPNDPLRPVQTGDAVTAGQTLFTIAQTGGYIVRAEVDEQDIIGVALGQRANVSGEDFPGHVIAGHVSDIAPVAVKSTDATSTAKKVLTTISLDSSPSFLRDGMSADVDILTDDIKNALLIPNSAIVKEKGASYAYVVVKGIAHKRLVRTGKTNDTQTQIVSGLNTGDTIVAEKAGDLKDGVSVKPHAAVASPAP